MKFVSIIALIAASLVFFSSCAAPVSTQQGSATVSSPQPENDRKANDLSHVKNVVNTRQGALQGLYRKQIAIKAMQGSLNIKLYITEEGMVQNADISIDEGMLSPEFIASVRQEVMTWRFIIREKMIYSFKVQFRKL